MNTVSHNQNNTQTVVCELEDLIEGSGVAVKLGSLQLALFYLPEHTLPECDTRVFAVTNYDPIGKANVIARGIVGDVDAEPVVASPLYKQHFSLLTGRCIEQPEVALKAYRAELIGRQVAVWL